MKIKILKIEVEKSRLIWSSAHKQVNLLEMESAGTISFTPILPVLVSDEEIKPHDEIIYDSNGNPWAFATQDTEELYEDLASGKLEFNKWYEFATSNPEFGQEEGSLSQPLRVVEGESLGVLQEGESNADEQPNFDHLSKEEIKDPAITSDGDGISIESRVTFQNPEKFQTLEELWDQVRIEETPKAPTDEEIDLKYPEHNSSGELLCYNMARREGAKWLRDQMLNDKE